MEQQNRFHLIIIETKSGIRLLRPSQQFTIVASRLLSSQQKFERSVGDKQIKIKDDALYARLKSLPL